MVNRKFLLFILSLLVVIGLSVSVYYSIHIFKQPDGGEDEQATILSIDALDQIGLANKIVVGIAVNKPPFASYNSDFQIVGFEPALWQKIGKKLGARVEFVDYARDGLLTAIYNDEIDMALIENAENMELRDLVAFTNVIFTQSDALLARSGSNIPIINQMEQLSSYRVGVLANSIHVSWLEENLVKIGKMPVQNVLVYAQSAHAIADLMAGKIDLVLMDEGPARKLLTDHNLEIVGKGLNQFTLRIAMRKNEPRLFERMNRLVYALSMEGGISETASIYLENSTIPPAPIPTPTPKPEGELTNESIPGCFDDMIFVRDLNLSNANQLDLPVIPSGMGFVKGWRIKNTGTCTWNQDYHLGFAGGNLPYASMGFKPVTLQKEVSPGEMVDVHVSLLAPIITGSYRSSWYLYNGDNHPFGQRLWLGVQVASYSKPENQNIHVNSDGIIFLADRNRVDPGSPVTFNWDVPEAKQVYFYRHGQNFNAFPVNAQAGTVVYPAQTTTYELMGVLLDGKTITRQIQIVVNQPDPGKPAITRFTIDPRKSIIAGGCGLIRWAITGTVDNVRLYRDSQVIWENAPVRGALEDCPEKTGWVVYQLEFEDEDGNHSQQNAIEIIPSASLLEQNDTQTILAPVVEFFSIDPNPIQAGGCVSVAWEVSGNAERVQIRRNGIAILENADYSGYTQDCLLQAGEYEYQLVAESFTGESARLTEDVEVIQAPLAKPLAGTVWKLASYYDTVGALIATLPDASIILRFQDDTSLDGNSGCNNYSNMYRLTGKDIRIMAEQQQSEKMCKPEVMNQEMQYKLHLLSAVRIEYLVNQLVFYDKQGQILLVFERVG